MDTPNPKSTAAIAGHPLHAMIVPFPIAFFASTAVTDILYQQTRDPAWATASTWLLGAGLATAAVAAVLGLIDFLGERRIRDLKAAWLHMIGNVGAVTLSLANFLIHTWDEGALILPYGLALSLVVALLLVFNGWMGWEMVYRHRVGVADARDTAPARDVPRPVRDVGVGPDLAKPVR